MNRLSILLVIAFASYSLGAPENDAQLQNSYSEYFSFQDTCISQAASSVNPESLDENEGNEYVDSYEIGHQKLTKKGYADITLKFHTAPHGAVKLDGVPVDKIFCAAKCAFSCLTGKNTVKCLFCMGKCLKK